MKPIFEYTNYRKYLSDYYHHQKENSAFFSFRYFSKRAGFNSPQMFKYIMDGERNLGPESIEKFISALRLKQREAAFFRALVNFNQSKTDKIKDTYFKELLRFSSGNSLKQMTKAQYEAFSHWYYIPIREMAALDDFKEDAHWIAAHLKPAIKPAEAGRALELLKKLGILRYDENRKLVQSDSFVKTEDEVQSLFLRKFHYQMIQLAQESIERVPREEREISSVTISIPKSEVQNIKTMISAFEDDILEMIAKKNEKSETIYQLNFQFFPLIESERTR